MELVHGVNIVVEIIDYIVMKLDIFYILGTVKPPIYGVP